MGAIADDRQGALMAQIDSILVSASVLPRRGDAMARGGGGRIVNVAARPALEPRTAPA